MDDEAAKRAAVATQDLQGETVDRARQLSAILTRTARALEWSAGLAEEHAQRHEQLGYEDQAAAERATAARASDVARRVRVRAEELNRPQ